MNAEHRQVVHEAAQRVTKYLFRPPAEIPSEVRTDMLTLALFGWAKCTDCQEPVSELGALCVTCAAIGQLSKVQPPVQRSYPFPLSGNVLS